MRRTAENANIGEEVVLNGWVAKRRNLGGLIFCDLRDKTGITQIVFNDKIPQELFDRADIAEKRIRCRQSRERVMERESKNPELPTGEHRSVCRRSSSYIPEADTPPIYIKDDDNVDDNLRLKYRYLDLRKKKMQDNLTIPTQADQTGERLLLGKRLHRKSRLRCS